VQDGAKRNQDGAAVVEQTRDAFLTIGQAVDDMTARIEQIAVGAQQITASAASMQQGMNEIEAVAEQSSAHRAGLRVNRADLRLHTADRRVRTRACRQRRPTQLKQLVGQFKTVASHTIPETSKATNDHAISTMTTVSPGEGQILNESAVVHGAEREWRVGRPLGAGLPSNLALKQAGCAKTPVRLTADPECWRSRHPREVRSRSRTTPRYGPAR
jgi:hypothetical protein